MFYTCIQRMLSRCQLHDQPHKGPEKAATQATHRATTRLQTVMKVHIYRRPVNIIFGRASICDKCPVTINSWVLCRAFCHGGGGLKVYSYCKSTELCYLCTSMLMVGISKKISKAVALS